MAPVASKLLQAPSKGTLVAWLVFYLALDPFAPFRAQPWLRLADAVPPLLATLLNLLSIVTKTSLWALLSANWRSFPLVWHVDVLGVIPRHMAARRRRGLYSPKTPTADIRPPPYAGVSPQDVHHPPFRGFSSIDMCDFNLHMSNSCYARILDVARMEWIFGTGGEIFMDELNVAAFLGQTSFRYVREIPMLTPFEIDFQIVSWNDKWMYYFATFTTSPPRGAGPRVVNCVAFNCTCFKIKGSRLTIPPARVLSAAGFGGSLAATKFRFSGSPEIEVNTSVDPLANWNRYKELRDARALGKWLKYGGALVASRKAQAALSSAVAAGVEGSAAPRTRVDALKSQDSPQSTSLSPAPSQLDGDLAPGLEKNGEWDASGMEDLEPLRVEGLKRVYKFAEQEGWELVVSQ